MVFFRLLFAWSGKGLPVRGLGSNGANMAQIPPCPQFWPKSREASYVLPPSEMDFQAA